MKIELKNVSKGFKNINILKDVNLSFESGNIYGLYGRNGSGKSILLKLICGLYIPDHGEILYDSVNLNEINAFPPNLRALIERPSFYPDLTGYQNLKMLADIQKKIGEKEILNALEVVNLLDEKDKKYSKYSLGMKQKLGIAQVIMEDPEIMLLDEPFNGIEQKTVDKLIDFLLEEKKRRKLIIICTHIKEDLERLTTNTLIVDDGTVCQRENK